MECLHDEEKEAVAQALQKMEKWKKNWDINYAQDLSTSRGQYELMKA